MPNPETIAVIQQGLFIAAGVVFFCSLVAGFFYIYSKRSSGAPSRATQGDLANMMILLQTMRDLLNQQKELARQLNESLDKKVAFIKDTVDTAMRDLDTLRGEIGSVAHTLPKIQASVAHVQEQADAIEQALQKPATGAVPRASSRPVAPAPAANAPRQAPKETPAPETPKPNPAPKPAISPELQVLTRPAPSPDLLDNWVGLDIGGTSLEPSLFDAPDEPPTEPENPEAAREAFRALLNMQAQNSDKNLKPSEAAPSFSASGGNGKGKLSPLQARVYEYRDAGMSISEIANEIGIGKGEVRLILSIRKDRV